MYILKKKYLLLFPLWIAIVFGLDKIFLFDVVRDHWIQPGGMLYYRQRKEQLERLRKYIQKTSLNAKKLVIVLGDSRVLGIGQEVAKISHIQNIDIWNFAGPQAVPAYYLFIAEKILKFTRPDYFYIGISPDALNRNSGIFASPVLNFGVDEYFIQKYRNLIPQKDYQVYQKTRRYALAGLQFSLRTLLKRIKGTLFHPDIEEIIKKYNLTSNHLSSEEKKVIQILYSFQEENLSFYHYQKSPQRILLNMTKGAQYAWFGKMSDRELKQETQKLKSLYLNHFVVSQEQIIFLRFLLEKIKKKHSKAILFFPRVNPYLRKLYQETPAIQQVQKEIRNLSRQFGFPLINLNQDSIFNCNDYYDSSHLSVSCFPRLLKILVQNQDSSIQYN